MKVLFIVLPIIILIGMGVWGFFSFINLKKTVKQEEKYKEYDRYTQQEVEKTRTIEVEKTDKSRLAQFISSIVLAVASVLVLFFVPASYHQVDAGEIAVVKVWGDAKSIKTAGLHFDLWISTKYNIYDAKVQSMQITTAAYSSDSQPMDIEMTVQWQIDSTKVIEIANTYGSLDILQNRIESVAIERTKSVLSKLNAEEIIKQREGLSQQVEEKIKEAIDDAYLCNVTTAVLTNIDFSDAFENAVEERMRAEQEKQTAITRAEQELEVAKKAAEAKIVAAQADAEAQKEIADAEAYATQIKIVELARTLGYKVSEEKITEEQDNGEEVKTGIKYTIDWNDDTDNNGKTLIMEYLKYLEYLATWNGELPDVVSGSDLSIFIPTQP